MPTAEYYQAIKLLNDKHEDNWIIAMDMCSEEEKSFIREAFRASEYVQDGLKEITLRKCDDGLLRRHHHIYKRHPEYPNILVSNNGRIFQIKTKVSESDSEVTYIVAKRNCISYSESGNGRIAILGVPVLIKNLVYDTFVGDRKKRDVILNINGDKRDNRLSNLKIETPMDRLMRNDLYQHLDEIVEMQKQNIKLEFIAGKFEVTRNTLVWFLYRARKLGVIEK
ncbi:HNH endonuclease [Enterococcus cecorum]|nr:HNH endonuclease [Enterococcus cecorum]